MAVIQLFKRAHEVNRRDDSTTNPAVVKPPPTSVRALTGFIVVLGLIILGFVAWKIGKWRRKKIRAASQTIGTYVPKCASVVHVDLEKPETQQDKVDINPEPYKWRPISRPPVAHSSNKATKKGTTRFFGSFVARKPSPLIIESLSPPPAYSAGAPMSPPTIVIAADNKVDLPATPMPSLTVEMLKTDPIPTSPLPSPVRTKSIGPESPLHKNLASVAKAKLKRVSGLGPKRLPRLMVVVCTFVPSLADELTVRVGEPLMLMEEYEDEWCLVVRPGNTEATEKGVIPRFCLQEIPLFSHKRASMRPPPSGRE